MAALPAQDTAPSFAFRHPRRACAGFTLIELVVVLLVAVLGFAALGGSIGSGNKTTQLQALARDLASALRYAHGQALATQQQTSVAIDLRNNSYQISNRDKVYTFAEEVDVSLVIAEEEFGADQIGSIRFFGDGSSTGGRITLEWGNQLRRIDVNWITGEVRISDAAA
ncbi:GspH/FimT family pseudopilin [Methylomonas sp. SURF-1]|uniref:Type II secretion system protein H n=1 Tax=Methylomonas aurea TaxID=2952224 RepID=A0ABT1UCR1_9GAMM|nr:GspH/FimT family pseudopilin [Methylomonas sp. SURF-1]MCQ8180001.1 GspH/FimT family pseudopilin [Methylomonas sp. SURF-1]